VKAIPLGERAALFNQGSALFLKDVAAGLDLFGATLNFGQFE